MRNSYKNRRIKNPGDDTCPDKVIFLAFRFERDLIVIFSEFFKSEN